MESCGEKEYRFGRYHQKECKQAEGKIIENFIVILLLNNGEKVIQKGDTFHGYRNSRK